MSQTELNAPAAKPAAAKPAAEREAVWSPDHIAGTGQAKRRRILPVVWTCLAVVVAAVLGRAMWNSYMNGPWTRDGTVRAYVVAAAPEVAGNIVVMKVADNQFVHKGDLLLQIDPTNYRNAVRQAEAARQQAEANLHNIDAQISGQEAQIAASEAKVKQVEAALIFARQQAARYEELQHSNAGSLQNAQQYESQHQQQEAAYASAQADLKQTHRHIDSLTASRTSAEAAIAQASVQLDQAKVNLERTEIRSPVNGWVTNLLAQLGDYAAAQRSVISIVDANSFWVDAYFEETKLAGIRTGDPADIKLMGYSDLVRGHVGSIARAIAVSNARPNEQGVATVNPVFTWVRLAQRIPVRIQIDKVPPDVILAAGMTASVQIVASRREAR